MDITKNIGLKIRALRKQKGLSQAKLAEMIDRSTEAVSNLERGTSLPGIETLVRLGQQLDTPIHYFFDNALTGQASRRCTEMIAELQTIAYSLSDEDLEIAVKQMRAFKQRRN